MRLFLPEPTKGVPTLDFLDFGSTTKFFQGSLEELNSLHSSTLGNSDITLYPHDIHDWRDTNYLEVKSLAREKPLLYFNRADFPIEINLANCLSLQTSVPPNATRRPVIVIPYKVNSLGALPQRIYAESPKISFVGYVPKISIGRMLHVLSAGSKRMLDLDGAVIRQLGVRQIRKNFPDSLIIERSHYGGALSLIKQEDRANFRQTYLDSIANADIVYCPRGDANASQRLYEVISAGRLPLVPDTRIVYPRINNLQYLDCFLHTNRLTRNVKSSVLKYWSKLDERKYHQIQSRLRLLYDQYLSFDSYIKNLLYSPTKEIKHFCYF